MCLCFISVVFKRDKPWMSWGLWLSLEKSSKARKALVGDRWDIGYSLRWKHPLSTPTSHSGVSSLYISTPPTQATLSQQNLNHISPLGPSLSQPAIALLCLKALLGLAWSCLDILSKGNVNVCVDNGGVAFHNLRYWRFILTMHSIDSIDGFVKKLRRRPLRQK